MSRHVDTALMQHLQGQVLTVCELLRLQLDDGRVFGVTSLDRDIEHDGLVYRAYQGLDSSVIATDTELTVGNAEVSVLIRAMEQDGLSLDQVRSGVLDNAQYQFYLMNYESPSQVHMLDAGDIGEVKVSNEHYVTTEILSYAVRLRNSSGGVDSIRCRAVFGSYQHDQRGCGVNADAMWRDGTVTGVGDEQRRIFADSSLPLGTESHTYRIRFTSGRNKSPRLYQVEAYSLVSGTIALIEPARFDIEIGDTFQMRPDCNKLPDDCKKYGNFINYKGEPWIPVADGLEGLTPSAQLAGGVTGGAEIED